MNQNLIMHSFLKMKNLLILLLIALLSPATVSCGGDEPEPIDQGGNKPDNGSQQNPSQGDDDTPSVSASFAKGADVSWITRLEAENAANFYSSNGTLTEGMTLLKEECGVNAVRLRVWVNPADGWNSARDVLAKAKRARDLGMDIMIDFHFSDTWADPGNQAVPAGWSQDNPVLIKEELTKHVREVLNLLKNNGITPRWIQIGNETNQGMLFPSGKMQGNNPGAFPQYINAGYDTAKEIFPDAKIIVHISDGDDSGLTDWVFSLLRNVGARFDIIGFSLYPVKSTGEGASWRASVDMNRVDAFINNVKKVNRTFDKPVILCEYGVHYTCGTDGAAALRKIMTSLASSRFEGVFYWEPLVPDTWRYEWAPGQMGSYDMGCFPGGRHNGILAPFCE